MDAERKLAAFLADSSSRRSAPHSPRVFAAAARHRLPALAVAVGLTAADWLFKQLPLLHMSLWAVLSAALEPAYTQMHQAQRCSL